MELEVPGADIVGFEHAAKTRTEKAAVEKATTQLRLPCLSSACRPPPLAASRRPRWRSKPAT